jgi:hypothetical protein
MKRYGLWLAVIVAAGCSQGDLTVPNYSSPTPGAISSSPLTNLQTRANGIFNLGRRNLGWNSDAGLFGRESFVFGTDTPSTTTYIDEPGDDHAGFA